MKNKEYDDLQADADGVMGGELGGSELEKDGGAGEF